MVTVTEKLIICSVLAGISLAATIVSSAHAKTTDEEIDQAIRICSIGTKYDGRVEGGLNLLKRRILSGEGEISYSEIPSVIGKEVSSDEAKIQLFDRIQKCVIARVSNVIIEDTPPPPGKRSGWVVILATNEAGGGAHRDLGSRAFFLPTPAAIDVREQLPPGLSQRNVFVRLVAETDHYIAQPGRWIYFLRVNGNPRSYTQCGDLELLSDGVLSDRASPPILTGPNSAFDKPFPVSQTTGAHRLTVKLACYFQSGQFPVIDFQLKTPSEEWRRPSPKEFMAMEPYDPDRPPGYQR
jgi:hypothetical protein